MNNRGSKMQLRLDRELAEALESGNAIQIALVYVEAAERAQSDGDLDTAFFLLTHAWVHALEAGSGELAGTCYTRLATAGRV